MAQLNSGRNHRTLPGGFGRYIDIEKMVLDQIAERVSLGITESSYAERSRRGKGSIPIFAENAGAVQIFSIAEAHELYRKASMIYGDDRERYACNLLADTVKMGNRRDLAGPPAELLIQGLRQDYPNFGEVIDQIEYAAALSGLTQQSWFQMPPLLLLGPPGIGKTAFAQAFAGLLGVYFRRIDVGTMSTASVLAGLSLGWGSGHTGEIFNVMTSTSTANPLIMLDEIDKMSGHDAMPLEPTLLSLLERESAGKFRDEAILLHLNCRHILWLATANSLHRMSEPLSSRFTVAHVRKPLRDETPQIIRSIYRKIRSANPWGSSFSECPSDAVIDCLQGFSPREVSAQLQIAFGKAARRGSEELHAVDITPSATSIKSRIGFM